MHFLGALGILGGYAVVQACTTPRLDKFHREGSSFN